MNGKRVLLLAMLWASAASAADAFPPIKLGLLTQTVSTSFEIAPIDGGTKLVYRPAQSAYGGVILGYRWLSSSFTSSVKASEEVRAKEGESQYADYRLSFYAKRFGIEGGYNSYKGYLIENSSALSATTLAGQTYYKLPDLKSEGYGVNVFYVLADKTPYSLPAAVDQSDRQRSSGGAWFLVGTWRQQTMKNSGPVIPTENQSEYGADALLSSASMGSYAVGGGYGYNLIWGAFFMAPLVGASVGYQVMDYITGTESVKRSKSALNVHLRMATGFNAHNYFGTIGLYADIFTRETRSLRIGNNVFGATVALGIRF